MMRADVPGLVVMATGYGARWADQTRWSFDVTMFLEILDVPLDEQERVFEVIEMALPLGSVRSTDPQMEGLGIVVIFVRSKPSAREGI